MRQDFRKETGFLYQSRIGGKGKTAAILMGICFFALVHLFLLARADTSFAREFTYEQVKEKAQRLVEKPYDPRERMIPEFLGKINYDAWRDIRFKPAKALWKDENLPFQMQFFHPGLFYPRKVVINVVTPKGVKEVPFSTDLFEYEKDAVPLKDKIPGDLGFAGFRLHHPINNAAYLDEVIVFLGASYFRAVAQESNYGLSARGIAINTCMPAGEEFPCFKEFWLVKPLPDAKAITIYALMDGPSVTGAYQFIVHPGKETRVDVKSTVFPRKKMEKLGIAPLTSMFCFGENTPSRAFSDFRPEIHDSDGLLLALDSGERIWRPLKNPEVITSNWFSMKNPGGFGLLQRDRDFNNYQDLEADSERRPSLWITPVNPWGEGAVELLQIPSFQEFDDNIVAMWVPAHPPEPKTPLSFDYTMRWSYLEDTQQVNAGRVVATRTSDVKTSLVKKFVIDFEGGSLETIPPDRNLTAVVTVDPRVKLMEQQVLGNKHTRGWRLVFQVGLENEELLDNVLEGRAPALELRAFLKDGEEVLTETWSYAIQP